jgi:hypothetical protein
MEAAVVDDELRELASQPCGDGRSEQSCSTLLDKLLAFNFPLFQHMPRKFALDAVKHVQLLELHPIGASELSRDKVDGARDRKNHKADSSGPSTVLYDVGDIATELYLIAEGSVRVIKDGESLAFTAGDRFGQLVSVVVVVCVCVCV